MSKSIDFYVKHVPFPYVNYKDEENYSKNDFFWRLLFRPDDFMNRISNLVNNHKKIHVWPLTIEENDKEHLLIEQLLAVIYKSIGENEHSDSNKLMKSLQGHLETKDPNKITFFLIITIHKEKTLHHYVKNMTDKSTFDNFINIVNHFASKDKSTGSNIFDAFINSNRENIGPIIVTFNNFIRRCIILKIPAKIAFNE